MKTTLLYALPARPRAKACKPSYPARLAVGLLLGVAACGGSVDGDSTGSDATVVSVQDSGKDGDGHSDGAGGGPADASKDVAPEGAGGGLSGGIAEPFDSAVAPVDANADAPIIAVDAEPDVYPPNLGGKSAEPFDSGPPNVADASSSGFGPPSP